MKNIILLSLAAGLLASCTHPKTDDRKVIKEIFSEALVDTTAYHNLKTLCTNYQGRICGTAKADSAVLWAKSLLESMGLDTVYLQPMMVKKWDRGEKETGKVTSTVVGEHAISVCALGWAEGTGADGVTAEVVEITSKDQLQQLGEKGIRGKIVFYNQPMDPTHYYTFESYSETVWQRARGASMAARYGAVAMINRSLTEASDDHPHTGIMHYADTLPKIPALAVSTLGADSLSLWLKKDPSLKLFLRTTSKEYAEVPSYNVIGEIRGTESPEEIIAFGGHIDAWDITQAAHDDGAGVAQTIEVLRIFKKLGITAQAYITGGGLHGRRGRPTGCSCLCCFRQSQERETSCCDRVRQGRVHAIWFFDRCITDASVKGEELAAAAGALRDLVVPAWRKWRRHPRPEADGYPVARPGERFAAVLRLPAFTFGYLADGASEGDAAGKRGDSNHGLFD